MRIFRYLLSISALLTLLIVTNCGPASREAPVNQCPPPTVVKANPSPQSYYTVLADENLPEDYKIAILEALNEWSNKTAHTLTYCLAFVDMSQNPPDTITSHTLKIYVRDPGPGYLGWTSWSSSQYSAYTFVRPGVNGDLFRRIMLHEFGHAFNLSFDGNSHYLGPSQSIMHPSIGDNSTQLCCPELKAFCKLYGCIVECKDASSVSSGLSEGLRWKETLDGNTLNDE